MVSMDVLDRPEANLRAGSRCGFGWRVEYSYKKCPPTLKICWAKNQIAMRTSKIMRPNDEVGMKGQITLP